MKKNVSRLSPPARSFVRTFNRYNILSAIRTAGMISRIDIAKNLGLSKASLTGITADLIKEGLILEKEEGAYQVGRRPILLAINPDGTYAAGVSISIEQIEVVVINFQAEVKTSYALPLEKSFYPPEELAKKIVEAVRRCITKSGYPKDRISGIGISIPGLVDSKSGIIRYMPNYGWRDVNLRELLQKTVSHPVFIDNDANTVTIAEHWFGNGKGSDNFIVIVLENGIGAGYVLNGHMMRGNFGIAGEFGHMSINQDGPLCRCGKRGCVEAYAGIHAIVKDALEIVNSRMKKKSFLKDISFSDVIRKARDGNPEIIKIFDKAGNMLGFGISQLAILLNPEKIIITGMGVQAEDLLFKPMHESIKRSLSDKLSRYQTDILIKSSTVEAFAKGAGTLVLQEIYKSPAIRH
jgi:transcriptional regulator of PTS gene